MIQLIAFIIFLVSVSGIAVILLRKMPVLVTLPKNGKTGVTDHHVVLGIRTRIKEILIAIEKQIYLHKILSWVKVMTIKLEVKIDQLLHGIRKKAQKIDNEIKTNDKKKK